jgi:hypothetical protein
MKDNYHKLCTDRGVTPLEEKYLAAYFIIGLNDLVHAEFKNSVTNNAKSGILAYPVTIVDAYQRVTDFRPMIDKKYASTGPVTDAVIFAASEKFPSGNKGGKVKTTKVTVPADESDSKNKEKNRLKKTRERLKKKSRVDSNGVTRWMDTGNVISCDNCKKKHLPDNHFDINCPEAQCQLDSVIAESKKTKNTTLSESIFMMHSSTSCSVQHVMSASNDLSSHMVLLDNQASISMVNTPVFLTNIRRRKSPVLLQGATGAKEYWLEGDSKNFGVCLLNKDLPCQIISYFKASQSFPIYYDQTNETFTVRIGDQDIVFTGSEKHSMYIHMLNPMFDNLEDKTNRPPLIPDSDSDDDDDKNVPLSVNKVKKEFAAAATVAVNESQYTKREVEISRKISFRIRTRPA